MRAERNGVTDSVFLIILLHLGEIIFFFTSIFLTPSLRWRNNGRDSVSNHQPHDCLLKRLFRRRSKKTSKLRVTGLCTRNSPGTCEFPAQMACNAENASIWWRHHVSVHLYALPSSFQIYFSQYGLVQNQSWQTFFIVMVIVLDCWNSHLIKQTNIVTVQFRYQNHIFYYIHTSVE